MAYNTKLKKAIIEAYDQFGVNYGSTRKHRLFDDIYNLAERNFAHWVGLEAALTVSSGTLAGQLVRNTVRALGYTLIEFPRLHPALKDIFEDQLEQKLEKPGENFLEKIQRIPSNKIALLCVAVDPLTSSLVNLDFINQIKNKEILIILDDTHGLGVLGNGGGGYLELYPELKKYNIVLISSLAKGISLPGGLIAGTQNIINQIENSGHFTGSSPISPAYLQAFNEVQGEYQLQRVHLNKMIQHFTERINHEHIKNKLDRFPIFILKHPDAGIRLKKNGIWISSIRYPYPHSELLNRIILNGTHSESEIDKVILAINQLPIS
jgi:7-keto-8-aminopelargonate synthetase-like enzyme